MKKESEIPVTITAGQGAKIDFLLAGLADAVNGSFYDKVVVLTAIRKYKREHPEQLGFEEGGEIERYLDAWIEELQHETVSDVHELRALIAAKRGASN